MLLRLQLVALAAIALVGAACSAVERKGAFDRVEIGNSQWWTERTMGASRMTRFVYEVKGWEVGIDFQDGQFSGMVGEAISHDAPTDFSLPDIPHGTTIERVEATMGRPLRISQFYDDTSGQLKICFANQRVVAKDHLPTPPPLPHHGGFECQGWIFFDKGSATINKQQLTRLTA